jgi:hypothetical protein
MGHHPEDWMIELSTQDFRQANASQPLTTEAEATLKVMMDLLTQTDLIKRLDHLLLVTTTLPWRAQRMIKPARPHSNLQSDLILRSFQLARNTPGIRSDVDSSMNPKSTIQDMTMSIQIQREVLLNQNWMMITINSSHEVADQALRIVSLVEMVHKNTKTEQTSKRRPLDSKTS